MGNGFRATVDLKTDTLNIFIILLNVFHFSEAEIRPNSPESQQYWSRAKKSKQIEKIIDARVSFMQKISETWIKNVKQSDHSKGQLDACHVS